MNQHILLFPAKLYVIKDLLENLNDLSNVERKYQKVYSADVNHDIIKQTHYLTGRLISVFENYYKE